ncbi:MAG TPA: hypothetical protein VGM72_02125 [Micropepsaceae bacterium]
MILGMPIATFTAVHVILSLLGIAAGLVVVFGMIAGKHSSAWTGIFLAATALTSVTGFPIPPLGFDPPRAVGVLSLLLLAFAVPALYVFRLAGWWRWIYVVTATAALYFNCFVGVVQTFQKIAFFKSLAPTQSEPPFAIAQIAILVILIALGALAVKKFHPRMSRAF